MRIKKVFENKSEYYSEITVFKFDYQISVNGAEYGPISARQKRIILKEITNLTLLNIPPSVLIKRSYSEEAYKLYIKESDKIIQGNVSIFVNKDEWYYVRISYTSKKLYQREYFYKCDQFDGLLKCLINNIKKL